MTAAQAKTVKENAKVNVPRSVATEEIAQHLVGAHVTAIPLRTVEARRYPWYEKVRAEAGRRGWSVSELARRVQMDGRGPCDPLQLRRYLKGLHEARSDMVARIARVLGWPVDFLARDELPYDMSQGTDDVWTTMVLRALDGNGKRVLAGLSDAATAEYLAHCLDQYRVLQLKLRAPPVAPPQPR